MSRQITITPEDVAKATRLKKKKKIISGNLDFATVPVERIVPFMLVPGDITVRELLLQIKVEWEIRVPRIILVMLSTSACPTEWMNNAAVDSLVEALIETMESTKMWILTDGYNYGLSKRLGTGYQNEMTKRFQLPCAVKHFHEINNPKAMLMGICDQEAMNYGKFLLNNDDDTVVENDKFGKRGMLRDLNPDHSHFIVLKGANNKRQFLRDLALEVLRGSEHRSLFRGYRHCGESRCYRVAEIPVVMFLIQGDMDAIDDVLNHLTSGSSVIVIDGSGGMADILALAYFELNSVLAKLNPGDYADNTLKIRICEMLERTYPEIEFHGELQTDFFEKVLKCVHYSGIKGPKYLTVLDSRSLNRDFNELPDYLLKAFFRRRRVGERGCMEIRRDLFLTMDWNVPNMARSEIFDKEKFAQCKIDRVHFLYALTRSKRAGFVDLFLQQGFLVHKILNTSLLLTLFEKSLRDDFFRTVIWEGFLGIEPCLSVGKKFIDTKLNEIIQDFSGIRRMISSNELDVNSKAALTFSEQKKAEQKSIVALVVWAALSNKMPIVKVLWKNSEQPIYLALFIAMIRKRMYTLSVLDENRKIEMKKSYLEYTEIAVGLLDYCYNDLPPMAFELVAEKNSIFGSLNMMEMAAYGDNKLFLAHPCCQQWIDNTFMGNFRLKKNQDALTFPGCVKVMLSAFLIFPLYFWLDFYRNLNEDVEYNVGNMIENRKHSSPMYGMGEVYAKRTNRQLSKYLGFVKFEPPLSQKIVYLWSAPVTRFWAFHATNFLYLTVFSMSLLWPSCGSFTLDLITMFWTLFNFCNTIIATLRIRARQPTMRLAWNWFEAMGFFFTFFVYLIGRCLSHDYIDPYATKVLLAFTLLFSYYRVIFKLFIISPTLGPLLYRVKRMVMLDFSNFLRVGILLMIGNGIAMHAILFPDFEMSEHFYARVLHKTWVYFFKVPEGDFAFINEDCIRFNNEAYNMPSCKASAYIDTTCPNTGIWPYIFVIQYVMLLKMVLMTMLFALFEITHRKYSEESENIWKFQRYRLVVEFSEELLPPPLCLISYSVMLIRCCRPGHIVKHVYTWKTQPNPFFNAAASSIKYWAYVTNRYCEKQDKESMPPDERAMLGWDVLDDILSTHKVTILDVESNLYKFESEFTYTQQFIEGEREDIEDEGKDIEVEGKDTEVEGKDIEKCKSDPFYSMDLSRQTPYPYTKVRRFPVPDSRLQWARIWAFYDPVVFSKAKENFHTKELPYVDDDVYELAEKPVFDWNITADNPAGVYLDRKTWCRDSEGEPINYILDKEGLPKNPAGRTGLRGKGYLYKWGPNHMVRVFITRRRPRSASASPYKNRLDFVVYREPIASNLIRSILPGGFIKTAYFYDAIAENFNFGKTYTVVPTWDSKEAMFEFFKSAAEPQSTVGGEDPVEIDLVYKGYMDDPCNTDQAWYEFELWHIHYNCLENLEQYFKPEMEWERLHSRVIDGMSESSAHQVRAVMLSKKVVPNFVNVTLLDEDEDDA